MQLQDDVIRDRDGERIKRALEFLIEHWAEQPDLARLASRLGLSEWHLQRLFTRWVGISPKRFVQYLTKEYAALRLRDADSLLDAALACGLSGTGRLHDLFIRYEGMSPGEFKASAAGATLHVGSIESPFGSAFALWAPRGLHRLEFYDTQAEYDRHLNNAKAAFPEALWQPLKREHREQLANAFRPKPAPDCLSVCVTGTVFQLKVWEALLAIPPGKLVTYSGLARALGVRSSVALGNAVSANALAWLVPCHRVICANGLPGRFRWGVTANRPWSLGKAPSTFSERPERGLTVEWLS
ncbi:hypothetical protein CAI21_03100 [Alkalilimnicola ehrlichii]|uniref:HTH araC/xylS-type domain-containing protein n=1 Tax=Alkalilimnicola ehrlichii TaxID=351052 RepID=A0A3E0X0Y1_9GAMM|nr:bifunctional helix-turn-helix domain-containing protein/methylated-DNA--[protein]-cysteine S-methyltransferase [Alkalilimnicola ehrlichii]RFA30976.1 hypothetical protein CAI21_03100 [Alkalilimnicola ehrlichii]RFA38928.1 hypothetical protein CAL65_03245 [Alkalilimnicola ehrlichii]